MRINNQLSFSRIAVKCIKCTDRMGQIWKQQSGAEWKLHSGTWSQKGLSSWLKNYPELPHSFHIVQPIEHAHLRLPPTSSFVLSANFNVDKTTILCSSSWFSKCYGTEWLTNTGLVRSNETYIWAVVLANLLQNLALYLWPWSDEVVVRIHGSFRLHCCRASGRVHRQGYVSHVAAFRLYSLAFIPKL